MSKSIPLINFWNIFTFYLGYFEEIIELYILTCIKKK